VLAQTYCKKSTATYGVSNRNETWEIRESAASKCACVDRT